MKKTDQNSLISLFKPIFKDFKALSGSIFLFFPECKIPKRECFPYIYKIFLKKAWDNNIPQIKKRPANKRCADFFSVSLPKIGCTSRTKAQNDHYIKFDI